MAKTLRSRIAAVAVVALGAGMLSAFPAQAVSTPSPSVPFTVTAPGSDFFDDTDLTDVTVEQEAGASNYVELEAGASAASDSATDFQILKVTGGNFAGGTYGNGASATPTFSGTGPDNSDWVFNGSTYANSYIAYLPMHSINGDKVRIATPTVGTIKVEFINRTISGGAATDGDATQTFTITVVTTHSAYTYAKSTVTDAVGTLGYKTANAAGEITGRYAKATAATDARFSYSVTQKSATGATLATGYNKAVVATLTGPGVLHKTGGSTTVGSVTDAPILSWAAATGSNTVVAFDLRADGRAGTSTVEIKVNGVVVKTYTVKFFGAVASYEVTAAHSYIKVGSTTDAIAVTAKDANGTLVPGASIVAKSSATTVATVGTPESTGDTTGDTPSSTSSDDFGVAYFDLTGVALGDATITFANAATDATVTKTAAIHVTGSVIKSLTWAFDKATYAPGEKAVITFTVKDANGNPIADDSYTVFDGNPTTNVAFASGSFTSTALTTKAGVATKTVYMPGTVGDVKVSALLVDGAIFTADSGLRGAATSISAKVINADLDAVKAQVAALTTTITAIQTAIATLVASTSATLTVLTNKINKIMKKLKIK